MTTTKPEKPDTLAAALARFQSELPRVTKDSKADAGTYSYRYADLATVSSAVLPLLAKNGLSFSAIPTLLEDGKFVLEYTLRHADGEFVTGRYPLPSANPQQTGSAITYARRYALCAITGVAADEDDDGKAANSAPMQHPAEPYYDHDEQQMLVDGYLQEISHATNDAEILEIGGRAKAQLAKKVLSPTSYGKLNRAAATKRAEIAAAEAQSEQETAEATA